MKTPILLIKKLLLSGLFLFFLTQAVSVYGGVNISEDLTVKIILPDESDHAALSTTPGGKILPIVHIELAPHLHPDAEAPSVAVHAEHPETDRLLQKEIESANVVRASFDHKALNGPELFFTAETPQWTDRNLLKFYQVSSKWKVFRKNYSEKILASRKEHFLENILNEKPEFKKYNTREKNLIKLAAANADILIRKGSCFIYPDGPVSHVRRGTFADDDDLSFSAIWIGEKLLELPADILAWLWMEQAQHIVFPERSHGQGEKHIAHSSDLEKILASFVEKNDPQSAYIGIHHTDYSKTRKKEEPGRKGFGFSRKRLSGQRQKAFRSFLNETIPQRTFGLRAKNKLIKVLTHMREESLRLRQPYFGSLDVNKILRSDDQFDIDALIRDIAKEKERYLKFRDREGKQAFSHKQIELLLFKNLIPFKWVEEFYEEGFSKNLIMVIMEAWHDPQKVWHEKKPDRDLLVKDGIPRHWAACMALTSREIVDLWHNQLRPVRDQLTAEGVPNLWATYMVLIYKDKTLGQWRNKISKIAGHYIREGFSKPKAYFYSIIDSDIYAGQQERPVREKNKTLPVGEFSEGFMTENGFHKLTHHPEEQHFDKNFFTDPLGLQMEPEDEYQKNIDDLRHDLVKKQNWLIAEGLKEPLVSYLLNAFRDPVDKWLKMREMKKQIRSVYPGLSEDEMNMLVFKIFNPKVIEDQPEARTVEKILYQIIFGSGSRGYRNYYQGQYFPSKLERNTAIILQHFGLLKEIKLGDNWQVAVGRRSFDFKIAHKDRTIFFEPHWEPAGQFRPVYKKDWKEIFDADDESWDIFFEPWEKGKGLAFKNNFLEMVDKSPDLDLRQRILLKKLYTTHRGRTLDEYIKAREAVLKAHGYEDSLLIAFESIDALPGLLHKELGISVTSQDLDAIRQKTKEAGLETDRFIYESLLLFWTGNKRFEETLLEYSPPKTKKSTRQVKNADIQKGGIDMNPHLLELKILNKRGAFPVPVNTHFQLQNIDGFSPVIINITPVQNVHQFLGLHQDASKSFPVSR